MRNKVVAIVLLAGMVGTTISAAVALSSLSSGANAVLAATLTAALPSDHDERGMPIPDAKGRDGQPALTKEALQRSERIHAFMDQAREAQSVFRASLFALAVSLYLALLASIEVAIARFKKPKQGDTLAV